MTQNTFTRTGLVASLFMHLACSGGAASESGPRARNSLGTGTDSGARSTVDGASGVDAVYADAGALDADAGPSEGASDAPPEIPPPPITHATEIPTSVAPPMDYDSAFFVDPSNGDWVVVIDRFTAPATAFTTELVIARSKDHATFGTPAAMPFAGTDPLQAGPTAASLADGAFLYFMHGDGVMTAHLARAAWTATGFGPPTDLTLTDPESGFDAWPLAVPWKNGQVALSYNHYALAQGELAFGDGTTFEAPQELGTGVQGRLATFADGSLVFTEQTGFDPQMVHVRVSRDGTTWTSPSPVTSKVNVHDATPFRRASGGVDLYYISYDVPDLQGFSIFRRSVDENGVLGPEQRLSDATAGSLTQPRPHRLADGTIVITFAQQVTSDIDTDSYLAPIGADDAP